MNRGATVRVPAPPTTGSHWKRQWTEVRPTERSDTSARSRCAAGSPGTGRWSTWSASTLALITHESERNGSHTCSKLRKYNGKQGPSLPFDPTAMSWLLQERLKHVAQSDRAIFFTICNLKKDIMWDYTHICGHLGSNIGSVQVQGKAQHCGGGDKQGGCCTCFLVRL